jgi:AsmA protein
MARHTRRLIIWIGGGILALLLLGALAVLALVWLVDPNVWRPRIAQVASKALGREVLLGKLQWQVGWNIAIASQGGTIANAPGFGPEPFAQWQRLQLGLDARALLGRRIVVDRLVIDGLQAHLQRNAAGDGNWNFMPATAASSAAAPLALQVGAVRLRNSQLTFTDASNMSAGTAASWRLGDLELDARLPPDLHASARELREVSLRARLSGGSLPATGVPVSWESASMNQTAGTLAIPAFRAQWGQSELSGSIIAAYGASVAARGKVALRVPSLRAQLAQLDISLPPMADPKSLGRLQAEGAYEFKSSTLAVTDLRMVLDDTQLGGTVTVLQFVPLALRFDLTGDTIDFDRYLEPANYHGKPFELPLAQLKALNVQGVLRINAATVSGAKASELRLDVQ